MAFRSLALAAIGGVASQAQGAGFGIIEQSASGLGAAFAGSAAQVNDASVQYFNPAGLAQLDSLQVVAAIHALDVGLKFTDAGSTLPQAGLGQLPRGATADDAGDVLYVPNLHVAVPLGESLVLGLSVGAPYGLKTRYSDPWIGRFQGLFSELKTLNINPALGWRVNDKVSLGAGVSYQKAEATLTNAVMLGAATEGRASLGVDDTSWGWNAGILLNPRAGTRLGLGYRSKIDHALDGQVAVTTLAGAALPSASGPVVVSVSLPEQLYLSLAQRVGSAVTLLADASYTHWSRIDELHARNPATGTDRDVLEFDFGDAWRFALGAEWRVNERWTLRGGAAFDETPVSDAARSVRLPDESRTWVTAGAQWRANERFHIDVGYAHLFVADASIASTRPQIGAPASFTSVVRGNYAGAVDIFSLQLTYALR